MKLLPMKSMPVLSIGDLVVRLQLVGFDGGPENEKGNLKSNQNNTLTETCLIIRYWTADDRLEDIEFRIFISCTMIWFYGLFANDEYIFIYVWYT